VLLYLAAKPTHVGVDADRLACPLHRPMACNHQTRGQGLLTGVVFSHHCSGVVAPFWGIFCGVLTMWILVLPNLAWSKLSFTEGTPILCQSHHDI
jgi:hypothetical protein